MATTLRFTYRRADKLKSRKTIDALFRKGEFISAYPIKIFYAFHAGDGKSKAGFSVSSRYFKKAVDRNRIKRLMRENWRLNKHLLLSESTQQFITVFMLYTGKELPEFDVIKQKMLVLILKLKDKGLTFSKQPVD